MVTNATLNIQINQARTLDVLMDELVFFTNAIETATTDVRRDAYTSVRDSIRDEIKARCSR